MKMVLYHGSNVAVKKPMLVPQNRALDFGKGFYTTENRAQAISFADKVWRRRKEGQPVVSMFEFDEAAAFSVCNAIRFDSPNEEWLDFVSAHRNRSYSGKDFELIYGPVANDDVYLTFQLYESGGLTRVETLNRLKVKKLYNQLVLGTERAIGYLRFIGILE
ncbi:MAG: DUF3990 domain-containing protein [Clostridiales bacterium]|jgi:hypothetical protein|nr:DUF3990 domain-containing protein [Clostridiales bacterium]